MLLAQSAAEDYIRADCSNYRKLSRSWFLDMCMSLFCHKSSSSSLPVTPAGIWSSSEAPPPLSVTGQPLDGAPAVVHLLHFRFHSSSPGCLWSTMLLLSLWGPVDCNFGDGVGLLAQHRPNPAPSLPGDEGLHNILLLAPC